MHMPRALAIRRKYIGDIFTRVSTRPTMSILIFIGIVTCAYAFQFAGTPPVHSQKDQVAPLPSPRKISIWEKILPVLGPRMMVNLFVAFTQITAYFDLNSAAFGSRAASIL